jgi:NADPH:quinone reductase-like Zn-dependent oxidoreductase
VKVYEVQKDATGIESLSRAQRPIPTPGPFDLLIRVRATSLNYRDHLVITGRYFTPHDRPTIPLSDGAGEVVSVGSAVSRFRPGDRVAGTFFQVWKDGALSSSPPALGVPLDGTLAEYIALDEDGVVGVPTHLSFEQAAALPCAGVTAWNALMATGRAVKAGETVLCLGTGGVSMLGMQFAKAVGARVIVTSSSDEKLERARSYGATDVINYKRFPEWDKEVTDLTEGRGVDHIIEIGGMGTLARSYRSIGFAGKIALIGFLAGSDGNESADPFPLMPKGATLQGIGVGSTRMFEDMNRAITINGITPIVDRVYDFDHAPDAFRRLASREFVGKIIVTV